MTNRAVVKVVRGQEVVEGAGVRIRRSLGSSALDYLDPFLDEFKSADGSDYIAGFPDHPHRGFETVTYMLAGAMRHEDHKGNRGELGPGSVQWMTAGRGIIHSEMPLQREGLMWGFQLWVNLPAREKMTEPRYQDIAADEIPLVEIASGRRRARGAESPRAQRVRLRFRRLGRSRGASHGCGRAGSVLG
jgi:redox-sensitive bicupin YhaK (pirin superfamily)